MTSRSVVLVAAVALAAAVASAALSGCERFAPAPPVAYDPTDGGWVLYAENDFSGNLTTVDIPILLVEGDASVTLEDGRLRYDGDSVPDDTMSLRTDYRFLNANTDYKIYVELVGEFRTGSQFVAFTGRHRSEGSFITAVLRADLLELRADGGSADRLFGAVARGENLDEGRYAFELLIESHNVTARLMNLETSAVSTAVGGALGGLEYYDGHDLRLRSGHSGTIRLDNYRIYTR
jgi:hypothetical protein